jgi:hypothetical protein
MPSDQIFFNTNYIAAKTAIGCVPAHTYFKSIFKLANQKAFKWRLISFSGRKSLQISEIATYFVLQSALYG